VVDSIWPIMHLHGDSCHVFGNRASLLLL
jgi:hypothetical protein